MSDDVDVPVLARGTSGFSGADLANLVNEAALNAARYNRKTVRMIDFEFAKDKVLMGSERRSMIISDEEKKITAVHEAGHALLSVLLPHADDLHKVTIIPRGMALGLTQQLPVDEKHNYSRDYLIDQIAILLGGRIAEEITMSGSHDDGRRQRSRARDRAGATDGVRVGHERGDGAAHVRQEGRADLPRPRDRAASGLQRRHRADDRSGSEALRHRQLRAARKVLTQHKASLEKVAAELLVREVLDGEQVRRIVAGLPLEEPKPHAPTGPCRPLTTKNTGAARNGPESCRRSRIRCRRNKRRV